MMRVLVVDDQDVVCEGLRTILNTAPQITVVGTAHNGREALDLIPSLRPDVVLMDLKMPIMNGIHATREIRQLYPHIPVLVLTTYAEDEWVMDAIRAGAAGYLLKDSQRADIIAALEGTLAGETHIDPGVAGKLFSVVRGTSQPDDSLLAELSPREREILALLAQGLTNAAIADELCLAKGTVQNYVSNLLAKLNVEDRAQATALAWRSGLVTGKPPDAD